MRALSPAAIIVDAGDRDRAAIRIDANGASTIVEGVLSLRGGTREQKRGQGEKPLHHDLQSRGIPVRPYTSEKVRYVIWITFKC
jgi:hypothetical protein